MVMVVHGVCFWYGTTSRSEIIACCRFSVLDTVLPARGENTTYPGQKDVNTHIKGLYVEVINANERNGVLFRGKRWTEGGFNN